ncbi:phospho-2-dehydro-3-deoxyheptonate aldolase [mine drainage metagenome]|uniref:Phospho-2-dehydro-3-deoxyheptonate aldolase n=1 Tax=mine drainage metagenome TaxID=410659 RepID=T1B035_9ZZZZ
MPTITEVLSENDVDTVAEYADILQIGARNMQNQSLIEEAAKSGKPIFLKRGPAAQIGEYLSYAERVVAAGNKKLMLCERGIIPLGGQFKPATRNTLDISAVTALNNETPFPVFVDPSHGTGRRDFVMPMALAAAAAGADGLMIEVHDRPEEALSDGPQALHPKELESLISDCTNIRALLRRQNRRTGSLT